MNSIISNLGLATAILGAAFAAFLQESAALRASVSSANRQRD